MDIKKALYQRGHDLVGQGGLEDILIPQLEDDPLSMAFQDILFNLMSHDGFRSSLRDHVFNKKVNPSWLKKNRGIYQFV